ncbi:uncharacterized protein BO66DRAFT_438386 [Aspergillus aculeatinus CBS 121060]|uniref:Uncharacterized protein n=1 Tax=Aspergillus aculeatinus CBS 121060 TaxID=1448322 RepID=A0ACD1H9E1_9EURO|nr:hypothetical protein BO66DRAFT_438386 [Aspergillus aculeatinus CBS 121060]RAH70385.1 hypothetical protein BO66DRAFT_438386 [Aspergillus aculeatinus CBS 121060]
MKRQRAPIACEKCRLLKAKCDGRQPICTRCEGYGFKCSWSSRKRKVPLPELETARDMSSKAPQHQALSDESKHDELASYQRAVRQYESLMQELLSSLDPNQKGTLNASLDTIRRQLPVNAADSSLEQPVSTREPSTVSSEAGVNSPATYVGKASDIHFIHRIRQCYQTGAWTAREPSPADNYTQTHTTKSLAGLTQPLIVPTPTEAQGFIEVYLSTIHVAYPFLCREILLEQFQVFQAGDYAAQEFEPWLALFNFIFAIGSYYTSFPHRSGTASSDHLRYFEQGVYFSRELGATCSLLSVWALIVQCFFLLAICHTDRCWNTLGFAIRMGQSIGLHVESSPMHTRTSWMADRAHWRRTWYSMYVLDRLLALQLGRPMAIHESEFQVEMPSVSDPFPFGRNPTVSAGSSTASRDTSTCSLMDYFIAVIRFSYLVGAVIRELYRPSQIDVAPDVMLNTSSALDQRLSEWKKGLPRHLRFDLGHTFESSVTFMRQRNMLAVKYHHLRALIHRPFLCLPLLQTNNHPFMELLRREKHRIAQAESTCVQEARQTAQLLHNLVDERSLVHDFPWWQMISCLICASSILFVAEAFCPNQDSFHSTTSAQDLREDAETCLKVFEALSANSAAARKAADMLKALSSLHHSIHRAAASSAVVESTSQPLSLLPQPLSDPDPALNLDSASFTSSHIMPDDLQFPGEWPSEISSAMAWSVQFFDQPSARAADFPSGAEEHSFA